MIDPTTAANQARANRAAAEAGPHICGSCGRSFIAGEGYAGDAAYHRDCARAVYGDDFREASNPARTFTGTTHDGTPVVVTVHDAEGVAEIAYREGDSFGPPVELSEEI